MAYLRKSEVEKLKPKIAELVKEVYKRYGSNANHNNVCENSVWNQLKDEGILTEFPSNLYSVIRDVARDVELDEREIASEKIKKELAKLDNFQQIIDWFKKTVESDWFREIIETGIVDIEFVSRIISDRMKSIENDAEDTLYKLVKDIKNKVKGVNEDMEEVKFNQDVEPEYSQEVLALAEELGCEPDEITDEGDGIYSYIIDNAQYFVGTYDEAREMAESNVKDTYDDLGLEAFTENFKDYILHNCIDEDFVENTVRENIEFEVNEMCDEEVVEEACNDGLVDYDDVYDENFELKEDVDIQQLKDDIIDHKMDEIDDYVEYFRYEYGDSQLEDLVNDHNLLNIDDVASEAVDWDGIAHFVATYDGDELSLSGDLYAYRID